MKYYGTKNNKHYGFYLESFDNSIEITDEYWKELLEAQNNGKIIIHIDSKVLAVDSDKYEFVDRTWRKLSDKEITNKQAELKKSKKIFEIQEQLEQLDKKRIRAIAEPTMKDENTTWLEYYNQQIQVLRTELSTLY